MVKNKMSYDTYFLLFVKCFKKNSSFAIAESDIFNHVLFSY